MKEHESTLHVGLKGTVINIEATQDCVFTMGYVTGDKLRILQLEDDSQAERDRMGEQLRQASRLPKPFYVCQREVGEKWLGCEIDFDLDEYWTKLGEQFRPTRTEWCEQCGWIHIGSIRGGVCPNCGSPVRQVIRELQLRPSAYEPRGLGPPGKEGGTVRLWNEYLKTKLELHLFVIALKNQADLLSGCCFAVWRSMGLPFDSAWYEI